MTKDLRYDRWFLPFSVPFGLGPKDSAICVKDGVLQVRFGWGFRTQIALASIKDAKPNNDRVYAWGAHGFRGQWLVNGSSKDIVELTIDPPARAYVMGLPIKLRTLYVSVTNPQELIEACAPTVV
jgi:hypothetical protein